jgi:hypothetical protein
MNTFNRWLLVTFFLLILVALDVLVLYYPAYRPVHNIISIMSVLTISLGMKETIVVVIGAIIAGIAPVVLDGTVFASPQSTAMIALRPFSTIIVGILVCYARSINLRLQKMISTNQRNNDVRFETAQTEMEETRLLLQKVMSDVGRLEKDIHQL